ncbi:hypothetical protein [Fluviicola sp.]|uniref:hypothetical protein n=1 Tax=Fluviicola sp. TaxID=1917219 RepID=UPI0031D1038B
MNTTNNFPKELVTKLIEQDLIYYRFLRRLDWVGLTVSDAYTLMLEDLVYELMGIEQHPEMERIYDDYMKLARRVTDINRRGKKPEVLAEEIYKYLYGVRKDAG